MIELESGSATTSSVTSPGGPEQLVSPSSTRRAGGVPRAAFAASALAALLTTSAAQPPSYEARLSLELATTQWTVGKRAARTVTLRNLFRSGAAESDQIMESPDWLERKLGRRA